MNRKQQERLSAIIEGFSRLYPGWRIGQMVQNIAFFARGPSTEALWDVEDEEFLAAAEEHLATRQRLSDENTKIMTKAS